MSENTTPEAVADEAVAAPADDIEFIETSSELLATSYYVNIQ